MASRGWRIKVGLKPPPDFAVANSAAEREGAPSSRPGLRQEVFRETGWSGNRPRPDSFAAHVGLVALGEETEGQSGRGRDRCAGLQPPPIAVRFRAHHIAR